ncbi:hypothetical protein LguiB_002890 [Lonicera macranthoides]
MNLINWKRKLSTYTQLINCLCINAERKHRSITIEKLAACCGFTLPSSLSSLSSLSPLSLHLPLSVLWPPSFLSSPLVFPSLASRSRSKNNMDTETRTSSSLPLPSPPLNSKCTFR